MLAVVTATPYFGKFNVSLKFPLEAFNVLLTVVTAEARKYGEARAGVG
jgi:hypothetical protein